MCVTQLQYSVNNHYYSFILKPTALTWSKAPRHVPHLPADQPVGPANEQQGGQELKQGAANGHLRGRGGGVVGRGRGASSARDSNIYLELGGRGAGMQRVPRTWQRRHFPSHCADTDSWHPPPIDRLMHPHAPHPTCCYPPPGWV